MKAENNTRTCYPVQEGLIRLRGRAKIALASDSEYDEFPVVQNADDANALISICNSHDALVAALEAIQKRADKIYAMGHEEARRAAVDCYEIASAALSQSRGKQP